MKIATKINLWTTAWLVFILLVMNTIVFFTFMEAIVKLEERNLINTGHEIIAAADQNTQRASNDQLNRYLSNHSFIRIVDSHSKITNEVSNDKQLSGITPTFVKKESSQLKQIGERQILIVRIPILSQNQAIGTLEIGQYLAGLEQQKDIVMWILAGSSAAAVLLSLLGGRLLSNIILKPISRMINTMEDIEQSGVPKTILINTETKDELHKMAHTFNRMIERIREQLEKQEQFVSDASHELRTPLTVIKSYTDLLARRGVKDEKRALAAVESIRGEINRLQKMTDAMLDIAVSGQDDSLKIKNVDLVSLCQQVLKQLQTSYKRAFEISYSQVPIHAQADELKIKQVIIILLDNAIKYSSDKIEVHLNKLPGEAMITMKDYGIGIPEEDVEHIFDRFYRVDRARNRATGGTGLGMAIAHNIIKQHNGEIKVMSKEGSFTEVILRLPCGAD